MVGSLRHFIRVMTLVVIASMVLASCGDTGGQATVAPTAAATRQE